MKCLDFMGLSKAKSRFIVVFNLFNNTDSNSFDNLRGNSIEYYVLKVDLYLLSVMHFFLVTFKILFELYCTKPTHSFSFKP